MLVHCNNAYHCLSSQSVSQVLSQSINRQQLDNKCNIFCNVPLGKLEHGDTTNSIEDMAKGIVHMNLFERKKSSNGSVHALISFVECGNLALLYFSFIVVAVMFGRSTWARSIPRGEAFHHLPKGLFT